MTTTRYRLTPDAWTKIATGGGRKLLHKDTAGEILLHVGKTAPNLDSPHYFGMGSREEFQIVASEALFARAKDGTAEVVVVG